MSQQKLTTLKSAWIELSEKYIMALRELSTSYCWGARICATLVLSIAAWATGVSWLGGYPEWTTLGGGAAMVPYSMMSFLLVGLGIMAASFHIQGVTPYQYTEGFKAGMSIMLLASSSTVGVDLLFHTTTITGLGLGASNEAWQQDSAQYGSPSVAAVMAFLLLAIVGILHFRSLWRVLFSWTVVGIGGLGLLGNAPGIGWPYFYIPGVFTGMAWLTAGLLVLSGTCYLLMTKHWNGLGVPNFPVP